MPGLPQEKKDHLKTLGFGDDRISKIDSFFASKQTEAAGSGREAKEATPAAETPADGVVVVASEAAPDNQEAVAEPTEQKETTLTALEIAEAMGSVLAPILERLDLQDAALATLSKELSAVQATRDMLDKEIVKATPALSLAELINQSIIGKAAAQIDGRTQIAKDKPKEVTHVAEATGVGFVDNIISANRKAVAQ